MPSSLVGLFRKLSWNDFQGQPPRNTNFAAASVTNIVLIANPPRIEKTNAGYSLADELTIRIDFDTHKSWKLPDLSQSSAVLQGFLLDHEQGHYDITALVARDLFIRLMQQKGNPSSSEQAAATNIRDWVNIYVTKLKKIQAAYDDETGHSQANVFVPSTSFFTPPPQKGSPQLKWEGLIRRAFTDLRTPADSAPDGTPYKIELETILINAGIQL